VSELSITLHLTQERAVLVQAERASDALRSDMMPAHRRQVEWMRQGASGRVSPHPCRVERNGEADVRRICSGCAGSRKRGGEQRIMSTPRRLQHCPELNDEIAAAKCETFKPNSTTAAIKTR